jgi:hypothetical protein
VVRDTGSCDLRPCTCSLKNDELRSVSLEGIRVREARLVPPARQAEDLS